LGRSAAANALNAVRTPNKTRQQVTLEPYERDHAMVVGVFRPPAKKKD
jgi:rRNA 2'-O-methyltransferase fibrillarin